MWVRGRVRVAGVGERWAFIGPTRLKFVGKLETDECKLKTSVCFFNRRI
jgi:hypothetical protein